MRSSLLPALLAVFPLAATLFAPEARAQDIAAAEALFDRGLADMKAGKYDTGCTAIAESHRLDPRPGTLFTLATCEAEWGHVATAVTRYGDYLALYQTLPKEKQENQGERPKVAAETRARLLPDVPQLTLSLAKDAPAGTIVQRNGEIVAPAALGISLPVDPGEYTLTTQTPEGTTRVQRITVARGEKKQVTLEIAKAAGGAGPVPTPAPGSTTPDTGPSGRRVATYITGAAGVAGLVAGGILGGLTAAQKGTIDEHCGAAIGAADETACDQKGLDAANSAKGLGLGSTIALVAGGVALGASVVLFVTEPRPAPAAPKSGAARARPPVSPGAWLSAGVLSAGPTGARVGVQGAF